MCDNKMNRILPELLAKTKAHQILSFLTLHPDQSFYDKEISERAGVSRGATNQVLNDFFKNNLVKREKRGNRGFEKCLKNKRIVLQEHADKLIDAVLETAKLTFIFLR